MGGVGDEFGLNMTLGASNVSFGLPDRPSIGSAFLPMAVLNGLTSAIMDARSPQLVRAVKAADLLTNKDPWGASWIAAHRARAQSEQAQQAQSHQAQQTEPSTAATAPRRTGPLPT